MDKSQPRKRVKPNPEPVIEIPSTVIVNLINNRNELLGTYDLPTDSGPQQLHELLLSLLPAEEQLPHNFFHKSKEIKNTLSVFFQQISYT